MKSRSDEFHSDCEIREILGSKGRKNCSYEDGYVFLTRDLTEKWLMEAPDSLKRPRFEPEAPVVADSVNFRMFVGTWNVGGKSPHEGLDLKDWLLTPAPPDIYVLGFQEIVPLNAGNVLGAEDSGPASKWLSLIRLTLNDTEKDTELSSNKSNTMTSKWRQSPSQTEEQKKLLKPIVSFSDLLSLEDELNKEDLERNSISSCSSGIEDELSNPPCFLKTHRSLKSSRYCLAASKQMVGIFLCVWVRTDLHRHVSNLKVSSVGTGVMGYLGNKGSVSISMTLHQTTFCFVSTHLASGEKEGDEIRRNSDVTEILRKTKFTQPKDRVSGQAYSPGNILEHDNIIWLGDLNYRLSSNCGDTVELLKKRDWRALLEKDQLMIEQRAGRVFKGWEEGKICFAPTYKYLANSDNYVAQTSNSKEKRRTPAWCDRILWKGSGLKQLSYVRGESRFSDHRPVYSVFVVCPDAVNRHKIHKSTTTTTNTNTNSISSATTKSCLAKIQAEELLLPTRTQRLP